MKELTSPEPKEYIKCNCTCMKECRCNCRKYIIIYDFPYTSFNCCETRINVVHLLRYFKLLAPT